MNNQQEVLKASIKSQTIMIKRVGHSHAEPVEVYKGLITCKINNKYYWSQLVDHGGWTEDRDKAVESANTLLMSLKKGDRKLIEAK